MSGNLLTSLIILLLSACGTAIPTSSLHGLRYSLEKSEAGERALKIEGESLENIHMLLTGTQGMRSEVPLGQLVPVVPLTKLWCEGAEACQLTLSLYKSDGTLLIRDHLQWTHRSIVPAAPIIAFSEEATPDAAVTLLIAENRDIYTQEIWIEGDLDAKEVPEGRWRPIPETSKIPLTISASDGLKKFRIKVRNEFGYESSVRELAILKKSQGPQNCKVELRSLKTAQQIAYLHLEAEDQGPVAYHVFGDIELDLGFQSFGGKIDVPVALSAGNGWKHLTVQIRDGAENYCLRREVSILQDPTYQSAGVQLDKGALWTDSDWIQAAVHIDHFATDKVEVFFYGDLEESDEARKWLPLRESYRLQLSPQNGHRWVRAQFKINGVLVDVQYAPIYLRPFLQVKSKAEGGLELLPSQIVGLQNIRLIGCGSDEKILVPAVAYFCQPSGPEVGVEFILRDGSRLLKMQAVP